MRAHAQGPLRWMTCATLILLAAGAASVVVTDPTVVTAGEVGLFLPVTLRGFNGPPTVGVPATAPAAPLPSATRDATAEPPATPGGSPTGAPTGATPASTPTSNAAEVRYPRNPETVILQIGRTDTTQSSQVFEEMNATPWFTLYGDGRIIAGREIFDNRQPLWLGQADEARIQRWLGALVQGAGLYRLEPTYHHPRAATPEVHVYLYTNDGAKRVSLRSFKQFEQLGVPEEIPEAASVKALVTFVRSLESEMAAVPESSSTPFAPDCYTVLAQQMYGFEHLANQFEAWEHDLNIRTIAEAAPTAASNYEGKVVGHKFVDGDLGREIRAAVRPHWEFWFSDENMAAAFHVGRLPYAVGARPEVPGGSPFLPNEGFDTRGSFWYRRDPGSGSCASLPRRTDARVDTSVADVATQWLGLDAGGSRWSIGGS